ncbi:MAG: metallophosphoesterase family protein [Verrucomicrobia bacterium]|nr:metallophosphoesterase family protein [Verrucomicrobiota bacterium]
MKNGGRIAAYVMAALALPATATVRASDIPLCPFGSEWSYLDDGSDQGTAWKERGFDASAWAVGNAELGYGDYDEQTVIGYGGDTNNKYITYYFIKDVWINTPAEFSHFQLTLVRDDAALVYINGNEVLRDNLPAGPITYQTLATSVVFAAAESQAVSRIVSVDNLLTQGWNTVAAEVHQALPTSSDISFNLEIVGLHSSTTSAVTRGPYLQRATPNDIIVRWRTSNATESVVRYGLSFGDLTFAVTNSIVSGEHRVELHGLSPRTTYYYSVGTESETLAGADEWHRFTTPPRVGEARPVRIWALGDPGYATEDARDVRDSFYRWNESAIPDLWLFLGDNAYGEGTDAQYQAGVFDKYNETLRSSPLWTAIGNHDAVSADSVTGTGPYYDNFSLPRNGEAGGVPSGMEAYYAFDYANIHFVCLDTEEIYRGIGDPMYNWLSADLAANTQRWLIVFFHHTIYSKGSHDSDLSSSSSEMRQNFLPLMESNNVDLVLSGHSHAYERSFLLHGHYGFSTNFSESMKMDGGDGRADGTGVYDKSTTNGAVYVVSGASSRLKTTGTFDHPANQTNIVALGSLVIDVHGTRMDVYQIGDEPDVLDYFTIVKDRPCSLTVSHDTGGTTSTTGGTYYAESMIEVSAVISNYCVFDGWTGDVTSSYAIAQLNVTNDIVMHALFSPFLLTNGTPQWWLAENGLGTNDAAALSDTDFDLMSAWEEYIAGTAPTSGLSVFTFADASTDSNNLPSIVWSSVSNRLYDVLSCPSPDGLFSVIANDVAGTPPTNSLSLPPDLQDVLYYLIRVRRP